MKTKLKLKNAVRRSGHVIKKNSPIILTGLSIVGFIGTVVLAIKATIPAAMEIEDAKFEKERNGEKFTVVDTIKAGGKYYIPAAITGVATIGCMVGSEAINQKRIAGLTAAYNLAEGTLKAYKDEIKEQIGPKKFTQIEDKVAEKKLAENPIQENNQPIDNLPAGQQRILCFDANSARYFFSNPDNLNKAIINLNNKIIDETYAVLNDFYMDPWIGLRSTEVGEYMGWDSKVGLRLTYHQGAKQGDPDCVVINFDRDPDYDWRNHFD